MSMTTRASRPDGGTTWWIVACAVTLVMAGAGAGGATRHWQTGRWTSVESARRIVDFGPGASGFGAPNAPPPLRAMAEVRTYVIEADGLRLELEDVGAVGRRAVDAVVGELVTFALEKNTVYVRGADEREFKLRVTKKTAIPPPA